MAKKVKYKIVVGDNNRRSAIWTVVVHGSDVYLSSTSTKQTKISLHQSGEVNWSMPTEVVKNAPFLPSNSRHLSRWKVGEQITEHVRPLFFVMFPDSELRSDRPLPLSGNIMRLPAPGSRQMARLLFTQVEPPLPVTAGEIRISIDPGLKYLFHHKLANGKFFVATWNRRDVTDNFSDELDGVRRLAWSTAKEYGHNPVGAYCSAVITDSNGLKGFVEVAPLVLNTTDSRLGM